MFIPVTSVLALDAGTHAHLRATPKRCDNLIYQSDISSDKNLCVITVILIHSLSIK